GALCPGPGARARAPAGSVCTRHVERDQQRLAPPAFEAPVVARLVLLEDEPSPPFGLLARLDDPSRRRVRRVPQPHRDRRIGAEVPYPVRPVTAAGQEIQRATVEREPDLDLVPAAGDAYARAQVAEVVVGDGGEIVHDVPESRTRLDARSSPHGISGVRPRSRPP